MPVPLGSAGDRSVTWLLGQLARTRGRHPALRWAPFDGRPATWTYGEFDRDVRRLAAGLQRRGVRLGDRVALMLDNCPDFPLAWAALLSLGAVAVCLNTRTTRAELGYVGAHSAPAAAIASGPYADDVAAAMPDLSWLAVSDAVATRRRTRAADDSLTALLADDAGLRPAEISPSDAASVQYTSGTTSRPKAVVWTHANCLWAGQVGARHQRLGRDDVNLVHLPLFHTNALSYSLLATWWGGGTVVLQPRFSASRFWDVATEHGCTWTSVVSFCLRALEQHDAPQSHAFRGWGNSFCVPAGQGPGRVGAIGWFGMTETVSHPVCGDLDHPDLPGSMGRPAPEYQVAVVDASGHTVEPGENGALLVRGIPGVSLFAGYLGDASATERAFTPGGWFRTGDQVRRDPGGTLTFAGRHSDLLKVGGENVGAVEIESVLLQVPGVREAAVVGRPDRMLGEVPVAFVLAHGHSAAVVRAAEARCAQALPAYKRPREIRVVAQLPRSTLNKIAKAELARELRAESERDVAVSAVPREGPRSSGGRPG
jgi:carnitine-CoA ligase